MIQLIDWLDKHQGSIMAILTLVYVGATILIMRANRRSVIEMEKTREEEHRPYVVVFFDNKQINQVNFVIQNIGKTLAKEVVITSTPAFNIPKDRPLSESNLLNRPIPNMPPNYKFTTFVDMLWDLKDDEGNFPKFDIVVSYKGQNNKKYQEEYHLDLNVEKGISRLSEKTIHDLVKEFAKFKDEHNRSMRQLNNSMEKLIPKDND
ncbi:hypothetical protein [Brevibacillus fortis]|uniref:hypothetical protein n=1 Tax=Brevibacillus fortis TaxID=2126352 RepID=UPI0038FD1653